MKRHNEGFMYSIHFIRSLPGHIMQMDLKELTNKMQSVFSS